MHKYYEILSLFEYMPILENIKNFVNKVEELIDEFKLEEAKQLVNDFEKVIGESYLSHMLNISIESVEMYYVEDIENKDANAFDESDI